MNSVKKLIFILSYFLLVTENFPQHQTYFSIDENINSSLLTRNMYKKQTFAPITKNNSKGVLDSLIFISGNSNRDKIAYNYNDDLSLNYFTKASWFNGKWVVSDKHTNTYNSEGNLESVILESFNKSSEEWFKNIKDVFKYDSKGNKILSLHLHFDGQELVNNSKRENCYDDVNNLVSTEWHYWTDSIWVKSSRTIYKFNSENLSDTTLFQSWLNNEWINSQITIYEYDENHNVIAHLTKNWLEQQWVDFALGIVEYDFNDKLVIEKWHIKVYNNWENSFRKIYEYDDNNNLIHFIGEKWENDRWVPKSNTLSLTNPDGRLRVYSAEEIFLYYSNLTSVRNENNIIDGYNLYQNYPNPFNPSTTISYTIPKSEFVQLSVYDLLGKVVANLVNEEQTLGSYEIEFNANNLTSGVYFYKLQSGGFTATKKIIILQ